MKDRFVLALLGLCSVLALLLFYYVEESCRQRAYAERFENTIDVLNSKLETSEIRLNDSVSLYQSKVRTLSYSKKNLECEYGELLKASKIRSKDVKSVTSIGTATHSVDTVVALVDTFGGISARICDEWSDISVNIGKNRLATIDYSFRDSLSVIVTQKKHSIFFGLFKWKSYESATINSYNPKSKITWAQVINVIK